MCVRTGAYGNAGACLCAQVYAGTCVGMCRCLLVCEWADVGAYAWVCAPGAEASVSPWPGSQACRGAGSAAQPGLPGPQPPNRTPLPELKIETRSPSSQLLPALLLTGPLQLPTDTASHLHADTALPGQPDQDPPRRQRGQTGTLAAWGCHAGERAITKHLLRGAQLYQGLRAKNRGCRGP